MTLSKLNSLVHVPLEEERSMPTISMFYGTSYGCTSQVEEVVAGKDYVLSIVFDNGEHGLLDMREFLAFGVFQRIRDHDAFKRV